MQTSRIAQGLEVPHLLSKHKAPGVILSIRGKMEGEKEEKEEKEICRSKRRKGRK